MKNYITGVLLLLAFPLMAYQTGPANRANFGANQTTAVGQNNYRSFSNYNDRNWGQGVKTDGVRTAVAGSSVAEFDAPVEKSVPVATAKKQAPASQPKNALGKPAPSGAVTTPPPAAAGNGAAQPNADAAAMMQQVQGMMQMVNGMTGNANASQPAAAGQGTSAPVMPAGMPDLSALMGGAATLPPSAPVKK